MHEIPPYVSIVEYLVTSRLALVAPDETVELVLVQEVAGDVRAEVGAGPAEGVCDTSTAALRVRPQDVEHLPTSIT